MQRRAASKRAKEQLRHLVQLLQVFPLPVEAGIAYGHLRAALERSGSVISGNDMWIAAHALSAGLVLVTNNEREFRRVEKLRVENWAVPDQGQS